MYKAELDKEIQRLKSIELVNIRMEEYTKYQKMLQSQKESLQKEYKIKYDELNKIQLEAKEKINEKEKEIERNQFLNRQQLQVELNKVKSIEDNLINTYKNKENQLEIEKKKLSSELSILENERRVCSKRVLEEIEQYKLEYERKYEHERISISKQKLEVEEKEYKCNLFLKKYEENEKVLLEITSKYKEYKMKYDNLNEKHSEIKTEKDSIQIQVSNLMHSEQRLRDILNTRDAEIRYIKHENDQLRETCEMQKKIIDERKNDYMDIVTSLRKQIEENEIRNEKIKNEYMTEYDRLKRYYRETIDKEYSIMKEKQEENTKIVDSLRENLNKYKGMYNKLSMKMIENELNPTTSLSMSMQINKESKNHNLGQYMNNSNPYTGSIVSTNGFGYYNDIKSNDMLERIRYLEKEYEDNKNIMRMTFSNKIKNSNIDNILHNDINDMNIYTNSLNNKNNNINEDIHNNTYIDSNSLVAIHNRNTDTNNPKLINNMNTNNSLSPKNTIHPYSNLSFSKNKKDEKENQSVSSLLTFQQQSNIKHMLIENDELNKENKNRRPSYGQGNSQNDNKKESNSTIAEIREDENLYSSKNKKKEEENNKNNHEISSIDNRNHESREEIDFVVNKKEIADNNIIDNREDLKQKIINLNLSPKENNINQTKNIHKLLNKEEKDEINLKDNKTIVNPKLNTQSQLRIIDEFKSNTSLTNIIINDNLNISGSEKNLFSNINLNNYANFLSNEGIKSEGKGKEKKGINISIDVADSEIEYDKSNRLTPNNDLISRLSVKDDNEYENERKANKVNKISSPEKRTSQLSYNRSILNETVDNEVFENSPNKSISKSKLTNRSKANYRKEDSMNTSYNKFNNIQYDVSKNDKTFLEDDNYYDEYDKFDEHKESVDLDVFKSGGSINFYKNREVSQVKSEEDVIEEAIEGDDFKEETVDEESVLNKGNERRNKESKEKDSYSYSNQFDSINNFNYSIGKSIGNKKNTTYNESIEEENRDDIYNQIDYEE